MAKKLIKKEIIIPSISLMGLIGGIIFIKNEIMKKKLKKNNYSKDYYTPQGLEMIKLNPGL